jgi:hypothetical protein
MCADVDGTFPGGLAEHHDIYTLLFFGICLFYLLNYKIYRLQILQVTVVLQLDCGKNNL